MRVLHQPSASMPDNRVRSCRSGWRPLFDLVFLLLDSATHSVPGERIAIQSRLPDVPSVLSLACEDLADNVFSLNLPSDIQPEPESGAVGIGWGLGPSTVLRKFFVLPRRGRIVDVFG